uniref:HDC18414 n=1 Tax=Drosophila melanogaster TaxID=7227 RepID=Q6IIF5_DROME|nr:TPA_inf: HDC18414 [Drosophila melanogaster]
MPNGNLGGKEKGKENGNGNDFQIDWLRLKDTIYRGKALMELTSYRQSRLSLLSGENQKDMSCSRWHCSYPETARRVAQLVGQVVKVGSVGNVKDVGKVGKTAGVCMCMCVNDLVNS